MVKLNIELSRKYVEYILGDQKEWSTGINDHCSSNEGSNTNPESSRVCYRFSFAPENGA